jgi:hypothetical protein
LRFLISRDCLMQSERGVCNVCTNVCTTDYIVYAYVPCTASTLTHTVYPPVRQSIDQSELARVPHEFEEVPSKGLPLHKTFV